MAGLSVAFAAVGYMCTGRMHVLTSGIGLAAGITHGALAAHAAVESRLDGCIDDQYRELTVRIVSDPVYQSTEPEQPDSAKFVAELVKPVAAPDCPATAGVRVQLSWYAPPQLHRHDVWQMAARLRPPWSYQNPGGFDYERWLFANNLQGTGYVRGGSILSRSAQRVGSSGFRDYLEHLGTPHVGLILALTRGDGAALSDARWALFRATGTVHLMVVSGLHVGMVTALCYWLLSGALRLLPGRVNDQRVAVILALLASAAFVRSTGAGVPAVRAWIMAAVVMLPMLAGCRVSRLSVFCIATSLVLLMNPMAPHQQGFLLSFGAAGVLLWSFARGHIRQVTGLQLFFTQLLLFVCLTPVLAIQQPQVAGISALSNLLVVPLLSLILPVALSVLMLWAKAPDLAAWVLLLLDQLLELLLWLLNQFAKAPLLKSGSGGGTAVALSLPAALLLLAKPTTQMQSQCSRLPRVSPSSLLWSMLLLLAWLSWLAPVQTNVRFGQFRLMALDVGQGSAIVIDTFRHRLLFDTGPRYPGGFDLGEAVVVPTLIRSGQASLDALVLSHDDVDHTGGAAAVLKALPVQTLFASYLVPEQLRTAGLRIRRCWSAVRWRWDGVDFQFLNQPLGERAADNDRSCVLKISSQSQSALISGDISAAVERQLVRAGGLNADLSFAPHHGSRTSSSRSWIESVDPAWVLISAPRRSRYGHPHPEVVQRYLDHGAEVALSGHSGALVWRSWQPDQLNHWRRIKSAYWISPPERCCARARRDDGSSRAAD